MYEKIVKYGARYYLVTNLISQRAITSIILSFLIAAIFLF